MTKKEIKMRKLLSGKIGIFFTRRFLQSKHVKMMSEGDYKYRIQTLSVAFYTIFLYLFIYLLFIYFKIVVVNTELDYLNQTKALDLVLGVSGFHVFILTILIIFLNFQTMNKYCWIFVSFYKVMYVFEVLTLMSVILIANLMGMLDNIRSFSTLLKVLKEYYIVIIAYIFLIIFLKPMFSIFLSLTLWQYEWERISKYQDFKNKENAFIFKKWINPEEIKSRSILRLTAIVSLIISNLLILIDKFVVFDFKTISYLFFIFNYVIYISSYVFPFNKISIIYFAIAFTFTTAQLIYCFSIIQTEAYHENNYYLYSFFFSFFPWYLSLRSLIIYIWLIKDNPEIIGITVNNFETFDDFNQYVKEKSTFDKETERDLKNNYNQSM